MVKKRAKNTIILNEIVKFGEVDISFITSIEKLCNVQVVKLYKIKLLHR